MNTKEMMTVMQAYEEGKTIEFRPKNEAIDFWEETIPEWNWVYFEYRVKPEQKINTERVPDECGFYHPMKREYEKGKLYLCRKNKLDWVTCICKWKDTDGFWIFEEMQRKNHFHKDWDFYAVILLDDIDLINRKFSKLDEELLNTYRNKSLDYFQKTVDLKKENEELNNKIERLNSKIELLEQDRTRFANQYINEKLRFDNIKKDVENLEFYINRNDELKDEIVSLKEQLKMVKNSSDFYYEQWNKMPEKAINLCKENRELKKGTK